MYNLLILNGGLKMNDDRREQEDYNESGLYDHEEQQYNEDCASRARDMMEELK